MRFEWDEQKNELNLKRHKIRFETAVLVFEDPQAITLRDTAHEEIARPARGRGRCICCTYEF